jgi:copper/silver efflux system protein
MMVGAMLTITFDPALRVFLTRVKNFSFGSSRLCRAANALLVGTVRSEKKHPMTRMLMRWYAPVVAWSLPRKFAVLGGAFSLLLLTIPIYRRLGSEFMPPLEEGSLLYMPSTMPGISIAGAQRLLEVSDRLIKQFPEVDRVLGKAGRAETPTDPAPLFMLETVIVLKPKYEWRRVRTWYSSWAPEWVKPFLRHITPDHISQEELVAEMNNALKLPGVFNAWTMPIKGRIDMLTTGIRTPVGLKISGADLECIEAIGAQVESLLGSLPETRSVIAERTGAGYFLDVDWNREELARYGLSIDEAQAAVHNAIGGENITTAIEARERYPVNVRYMRDFRSSLDGVGRVLVPAAAGQRQIPVSQLASIHVASGPAMVRNDNGLLTAYVYVDIGGHEPGGYIEEARRLLRDNLQLPPGYAVSWSGQFEAMQRVQRCLLAVLPLTLFLILLLLYFNTPSVMKTAVIVLAVPFSAVGATWFLYLLGYNMSIGVWVGLIALLGVDAETGVFMLL